MNNNIIKNINYSVKKEEKIRWKLNWNIIER